MLSSINPFVERARSNRWWLTVTAHVVGAATGGALSAAALGVLGAVALAWVPGRAALIAAGVVCLLAAIAQPLTTWRPGWRRQVDEDWLIRYRGWVYGAGFGLQLGSGVATHVATTAVYAVGAMAVLQTSAIRGLALGAVFGLVRGLALVAGLRLSEPERLRRFFSTLSRLAGPVDRATTGCLAVAGIAALVAT